MSDYKWTVPPIPEKDLYILTQEWHLLSTGGNGSLWYGLKFRDPNWKPHSGYQKEWAINHSTFLKQKEELIYRTTITEEKYNQLLAELDTFPKWDEKRKGEYLIWEKENEERRRRRNK